MAVLQLPQLAAIACAAAGSTAEASIEGRVPWPPAVEGLRDHTKLLHVQVGSSCGCKCAFAGVCVCACLLAWLVAPVGVFVRSSCV